MGSRSSYAWKGSAPSRGRCWRMASERQHGPRAANPRNRDVPRSTFHVPFCVVKRGGRKDVQMPASASQHGKPENTPAEDADEHPSECFEVRHQRKYGGLRVSQDIQRDLDTFRS